MDQTKEMLQGSLFALSSRLRDHIERVDRGVLTATDDLAVVLRVLIAPGKGNRVIDRAIRALGLSTPEIGISLPPMSRSASIRLSVGSIPISRPLALEVGSTIPVTKLAGRTFATTRTESWDWGTFISNYCNKWGGAHVDDAIPATLRLLECHSPANWSLPTYALRMAAVAVWEATQAALRDSLQHLELPEGVISSGGGIDTPPGGGPNAQLLHLEHSDTQFRTSWSLAGSTRHDLGHWMVGPVGTSFIVQPEAEEAPTSAARHHRLRTPTITYSPPAEGPGVLLNLQLVDRTPGREGQRIPATVSVKGMTQDS